MPSNAKTVDAYLAGLPPDRRDALSAVRRVILANLDASGYEEGMTYGMIGYYVPHRIFPAGYLCDPKQPVPFVNLGSQVNRSGASPRRNTSSSTSGGSGRDKARPQPRRNPRRARRRPP